MLLSIPAPFCPFALQFALPLLLNPFAYAYSPLQDDMGTLTCPITFTYGADDWIDRSAGDAVAR